MQSRNWLGVLSALVLGFFFAGSVAHAQEGSVNPAQCVNGFDDDNDGVTDCLDSDCWGVTVCCGPLDVLGFCDPVEFSTCSCVVDCPITQPTGETSCGDGVDNDCDGATDCVDPECVDSLDCCVATQTPTELTCNDGTDNDCDGDVDCADSDCALLLICTCPPPTGSGTCDPTETPCNCLLDCGAIQNPETTCDDGIDNDCDGTVDCDDDSCFNTCCGNGVPDTLEECDNGLANSDTVSDACRLDCTNAGCGDGVIDTGEDCDLGAGNSDAPDANCRTDCTFRRCGDGICDIGNLEDTCNCADCGAFHEGNVETTCDDIFDNDCDGPRNCDDSDCFTNPVCCGDGVCRPGEDQCTCVADCGVSLEDPETTCDDDLDNDCDGDFDCRDVDCHGTPACCGDGILNSMEECDLGLANNDNPGLPGITCRTDCTFATCGDGITDVGEECDGSDDFGCPLECNASCECPPCGDVGCQVNMRLFAPGQVSLNEVFEVELRVNSITGVSEPFIAIQAILIWNPSVLQFEGYITEKEFQYPYDWLGAGLPDDSANDGFNNVFDDGDAFFQSFGQLPPNPLPVATVGTGLLAAKFRFRAIGQGADQIGFRRDLLSQNTTLVVDDMVAGIDILQEAMPVTVTVPCNECPCTLGADNQPLPGTSVCMHETCDFAGGCTSFQAGYGDVIAPFSLPPFVSTNDILCAVQGFGNYCTCSNADIAGCSATGIPIGTDDILAVVAAFGGENPCGCPVLPQASAASGPVTAGSIVVISEDTPVTIELHTRSRVVHPGGLIEIDAFASEVSEVSGYELALVAGAMRQGGVELETVSVDEHRRDYIFAAVENIPLHEMEFGRIGGVSLGGGVEVTKQKRAYLGTFAYRVADDAVGTVKLTASPDFNGMWRSSIERVRTQLVNEIVVMVVAESSGK